MIDVVIATYNRFEKARSLAVNLISAGGDMLNNVIIVDSTDNKIVDNVKSERLIHFFTDHKNQPYQRYLGYTLSDAENILFLDDDMELVDDNLFTDLHEIFEKPNVSAVNIAFKNVNTFLSNQPKGLVKNEGKLKKLVGLLTGYPIPKSNQYSFCGIRGRRISGIPINFLSGGAFAVKRENVYDNFNMQLFDLYEQKLGKGEDGILGYTISLNGLIEAPAKLYFVHNDYLDSSYAIDYTDFGKRVMYSRLYLACEYYRLNKKHCIRGYFRFHHYAIGRISGALLNYIVNPSAIQKEIIGGYIRGWILGMKFIFVSELDNNEKWEAYGDLELRNGRQKSV